MSRKKIRRCMECGKPVPKNKFVTLKGIEFHDKKVKICKSCMQNEDGAVLLTNPLKGGQR